MELAKLNCPSCGGSINLPKDINRLSCTYCGTNLVVQRGEGFEALKIAEQVSATMREVGVGTETAIREGTQVTQSEIKRLQVSQDLSIAQMQLSNIQSEIRGLEREKRSRKVKRQISELRNQEMDLGNRIRALQLAIAPQDIGEVSQRERSKISGKTPVISLQKLKLFVSGIGRGCLYSFIVFCIGVLLIPSNLSSDSSRYQTLLLTVFIVSAVTFIYFRRTEASIKSLIDKFARKK